MLFNWRDYGKKYHIAFGVYGIIAVEQKLVVIKKNGGPYINRFDLPEGSLEDGEALNHAILREIKEETDLDVTHVRQLGITSFKYPWHYEQYEQNQHLCVFYEVDKYCGQLASQVSQFDGQDSLGAVALDLNQLSIDNSSPLVLKAKEYLQNGHNFDPTDTKYDSWDVLKDSVF